MYFLVSESRGRVVGYTIGKTRTRRLFLISREDETCGHVLNIAVAPTYRRMGVGARLISSLEDIFKMRGLTCARLEVRASNLEAQRLYTKLGYTPTRRVPRYYGDEDGILMEKSLEIKR